MCWWGQRACLCRESQRTTFGWYSLSTSLEVGSILHKPARVVGPEHRQFLLSRAATSSFMWILEIWTPSFMPIYPFPWPSLRFYSTLSLCVCVSLSVSSLVILTSNILAFSLQTNLSYIRTPHGNNALCWGVFFLLFDRLKR